MIEGLLHVALEHLEAEDDLASTTRQPFEDGELKAMPVRVVVLFTKEHDIGPRQVGDHRLEVRKPTARGIEDAFGHVALRRGDRAAHCKRDDDANHTPKSSGVHSRPSSLGGAMYPTRADEATTAGLAK